MSAVDFRQRLRELARFESSGSPVVSVYLNTEWVDEHQRERVRIFVKNALAEARSRRWADRDDLEWIERPERNAHRARGLRGQQWRRAVRVRQRLPARAASAAGAVRRHLRRRRASLRAAAQKLV